MTRTLPRGHSNAYADETEPWPHNTVTARIPIAGGAHVETVRALPPLALDQHEWRAIGVRMGWLDPETGIVLYPGS